MTSPFPYLLFLCLFAMVCALYAPGRKSRLLGIVAGLALFLYSWTPVAEFFAGTLERRFPVSPVPSGDAQAIVVLSSNLYPVNPSQHEALPGFSTYVRSSHAVWLFKNWKRLPVVASGGPAGKAGEPRLADVIKNRLLEGGVPESMIWLESESLSTHDNAVRTAALLLPKGIRKIALVTEGYHMLRAELCFRRQGFEVIPAPCAYRTLEQRSSVAALVPGAWAMRVNDECLHEWLALMEYRLRGWI